MYPRGPLTLKLRNITLEQYMWNFELVWRKTAAPQIGDKQIGLLVVSAVTVPHMLEESIIISLHFVLNCRNFQKIPAKWEVNVLDIKRVHELGICLNSSIERGSMQIATKLVPNETSIAFEILQVYIRRNANQLVNYPSHLRW